MSKHSVSAFYSAIGQDSSLAIGFMEAVGDKHAGEALLAISRYAVSLGYDVSVEDLHASSRNEARQMRQKA